MEQTYEVLAAVIVIVAFGVERIIEMLAPAILKELKVTGSELRTMVITLLTAAINIAILYGLDLDVIAQLLNQNQSLLTAVLQGFAATSMAVVAHSVMKRLGGKKTITEVVRDVLDLADELEAKPDVPVS